MTQETVKKVDQVAFDGAGAKISAGDYKGAIKSAAIAIVFKKVSSGKNVLKLLKSKGFE